MSVQVNYTNGSTKKNSSNLVFFVDEKFNVSNLKKYVSNSEHSYISDLLKNRDSKKKILDFDLNSKRKIILVSLKKDPKTFDIENLGAKFYDQYQDLKQKEFQIVSDSILSNFKNLVGYFLHGLKLKSYIFEKYKTKKKQKKYLNICNW